MEKQAGVSGGSFRLLGIVPRIVAIVLAVIVIGVSAATIGIIEDNETLEFVRDADNVVGDGKDLQDLINQSVGAAGWLIALGVGVLVGEVVAIILTIVVFSQSLKLVIQIIDILFSVAVAICYSATGIACAVFAAQWREPPDLCESDLVRILSDCDDVALTVTNGLTTVFCFIQTVIFGFIAAMVIYAIVKSRRA